MGAILIALVLSFGAVCLVMYVAATSYSVDHRGQHREYHRYITPTTREKK
jgi:hypothetical protein